ncbi:MAG: alpha/beta hydrolase [Deltaproteobacteria bacterium]|nr:alpha/beta hydrolase [Candidatus Zymogenaceae bacterium]
MREVKAGVPPLCAVLIVLILAVATASPGAEYIFYPDIVYGGCDGCDENLVSLDVYTPKADGPSPVVVFIHGGSWQIGDKTRVGDKAVYFTENGFVFVSVNYRLSPEVIHPVHIQDVARAVAWVYRNIDEYGGDPDRFFLMGHSAGAHLAALATLDERRLAVEGLGPDIISGVILLDGAGYDIPLLLSGAGRLYEKHFLPPFTDEPQVWRDASPMLHVEDDESPPPFLIIYVRDREESCVQAELLADRLTNVGGDVTLYHALEKNHITVNRALGDEGDEVTAAVHDFIEKTMDVKKD